MNTILTTRKKRIMAELLTQPDHPYFICLAGIHGNEHGGVRALRLVIEDLVKDQIDLKGNFIAIKGNLKAYRKNKRFIDRDLNRMFYSEMIEHVMNDSKEDLSTHEEKELKKILSLLAPYLDLAKAGKTVYLLDLHTTSAHGGLFTISSNNEEGIEIGKKVGVPVIIGINDVIKGTTVSFCEQNGITGFAFEGGQHDDPSSVQNIEAALWLFLEATGVVSKDQVKDYSQYMDVLNQHDARFPDVVQFKFRHHVKPGDEFVMNPGMKNFMFIEEGQIVAKDKNGYIKAPMSGMLLMPLYQKQGEDGFFITEEKSELRFSENI